MLTLHFTLTEFTRTSTGLPNDLPDELLGNATLTCCALEEVRAVLGHPLRLVSGYRCLAVNRAVGGARSSRHMEALASDMLSSDACLDASRLHLHAVRLPLVGKIIVERGHLHIEPRTAEGPIRWLVEDAEGVYRTLYP